MPFKSSADELEVSNNRPRCFSRFDTTFFVRKTQNAVNRGVMLLFYIAKNPTDILNNCFFLCNEFFVYFWSLGKKSTAKKTHKDPC